jgi:hypothetical protein
MELSPDYDKIFGDKLLVITGAARSGTTILGKIIGSFENTHYIFEPHISILIPTLIEKKYLAEEQGGELLKALLFEELYLQMIHGRYVNFNEKDDSYIGNYVNPEDVKTRWKNLSRRKDAIADIENNDYVFSLKIPNVQPILPTIKKLFPKMKVIHVIRDGNDCVSSSIRREFYSQDYFNRRNIEWGANYKSLKIPWYVRTEDKDLFLKWNQYTRAAYLWRFFTEIGMDYTKKNRSDTLEFRFEDFRSKPYEFTEKIEKFVGKKRSDISVKHIDSIKTHKQLVYDDVTSNVETPEREKYENLRAKLGYPTQ